MIKKTTLVALLCAIALGAAVYYFDWRKGSAEKPAADTTKPAFSVQASDITSFTIAHPAQTAAPSVRFYRQNGMWRIVQPIDTDADQSVADGIADQIAGARIDHTEPGSADRLKVYGLSPPQASIEFQVRSGAKHNLLIGDKDFTGDSVYTIVDGGQSVSLLPESLSTSTAKSLDDLRDRAVLHIETQSVASFHLKNSSGELDATKEKDEWKFTKPGGALAGTDAVDTLLGALSTAKMVSVASEKPDNLAKYDLASPPITFTAKDDKGVKSTLTVGKKVGEGYYARDTSRPTIFKVNEDIYKKLSERFSDLRDKRVLRTEADAIQQLQIHGANGTIVMSRKKDDPYAWTFDAPDAEKGKSAAAWKILDSISGLRAEEVIDAPGAGLLAQLAKPDVSAVLTDNNGKALTFRVSKPSGNFVYAQASDSSALYKLKKQILDDLNLKPADLALGASSSN
ncbi:MAG TPA: DUF4340 domain-containing protein [Candidatus Acidoferrales bacterium]|nr:DUF4340 domain-containing protein [Candidatus Acidoferrales bacterium]